MTAKTNFVFKSKMHIVARSWVIEMFQRSLWL